MYEKEIIDLFNEGYGYRYISEKLGLSVWTVRKFFNENNLKHNHNSGLAHRLNKETEILDLFIKGYDPKQISEELNCSYSYVINKIKDAGFSLKEERHKKIKALNEIKKQKQKEASAIKQKQKRNNEVSNIINERCPNFEFVEYYQQGEDKSRIDLRCKTCGTIINRSWSSVRRKNVRCDVCYQNKLNRSNFQKEKQKEERKRSLEKQKQITNINRFFKHEQKKQIKKCVVCGKDFVTYKSNIVCCSKECTNKKFNNRKDKRFKGQHRDYGITPKALHDKYNGVCWICGGKCDLNDFVIKKDKNGNDVIVCGNNYPSVDHIQPAYKGGTDTWDNVKLAHRKCNTERYIKEVKSDE